MPRIEDYSNVEDYYVDVDAYFGRLYPVSENDCE
jgi:hypothetical protein